MIKKWAKMGDFQSACHSLPWIISIIARMLAAWRAMEIHSVGGGDAGYCRFRLLCPHRRPISRSSPSASRSRFKAARTVLARSAGLSGCAHRGGVIALINPSAPWAASCTPPFVFSEQTTGHRGRAIMSWRVPRVAAGVDFFARTTPLAMRPRPRGKPQARQRTDSTRNTPEP